MLKMVEQFKADAVERLEAELAKLNGQGGATLAEIERLAQQEDDAETAGDVLNAMAATRGARNRLTKLEARIADLRERLDVARDSARAKLRADLRAPMGPAARNLFAAAQAVQAALDHYIAARSALRAAGFERDALSFPSPPHINGACLMGMDRMGIFLSGVEAELNPAPRTPAAPAPPAKAPGPKRGYMVPGPARLMRPDELSRPKRQAAPRAALG